MTMSFKPYWEVLVDHSELMMSDFAKLIVRCCYIWHTTPWLRSNVTTVKEVWELAKSLDS